MRIAVVYGTRPELIKLAPVIEALRTKLGRHELTVISSGQHKDLLPPLEAELGIEPTLDCGKYLGVANNIGALYSMMSDRVYSALEGSGIHDWVIVQGDTATAFAGAHAGFLLRSKVAHVEAGLRTWDLSSPFPEEANRQMISCLATKHFAPTHAAARNLPDRVAHDTHVVGNTVVDAARRYQPSVYPRGHILVTCHRNENRPHLPALGSAIRILTSVQQRVVIVTHPRPGYAEAIREAVGGLDLVTTLPPQSYRDYLGLIAGAKVVLTDSGGTVEEASAFGRPSVIFRDTTERPEAVDAGHSKIAGHNPATVAAHVLHAPVRLLQPCPFGDGHASERIAQLLGVV